MNACRLDRLRSRPSIQGFDRAIENRHRNKFHPACIYTVPHASVIHAGHAFPQARPTYVWHDISGRITRSAYAQIGEAPFFIRRIDMTRMNLVIAAAMISAAGLTSTLAQAQAAISEPGAFQAANPDRDVLNGGSLRPGAVRSAASSTRDRALRMPCRAVRPLQRWSIPGAAITNSDYRATMLALHRRREAAASAG